MNVGFRDTGDRLDSDSIWPEEILKAKDKVKIGDKLTILDVNRFDSDSDTFGAPVKAVVIAKYPFLVLLSNGMSATYTQLAMYYRRNGRRRCIC